MTRVAIVDCGMGNLDSVARAIAAVGGTPCVTADPLILRRADRLILPGVGAFAAGMASLHRLDLPDLLAERVMRSGVPFLGICLGMQLLAESGDEGGPVAGLGWIGGCAVRLVATSPDERLPHVGWNEVTCVRPVPLWAGIAQETDFYFVHSYHLAATDPTQVLGHTPYAGGFVSAVQADNVSGVQFHPEKSQRLGLRLLHNFVGA